MNDSEAKFAGITDNVSLTETEKAILREFFGLPHNRRLLPAKKDRKRLLRQALSKLPTKAS